MYSLLTPTSDPITPIERSVSYFRKRRSKRKKSSPAIAGAILSPHASDASDMSGDNVNTTFQ